MNKTRFNLVRILFVAVLSLSIAVLQGCSKDISGSSSGAVTGVAATGSPISGTIYLEDSSGHSLSAQTTDGTFSFDTSAMSPPFLLKAAWGSQTIYSFAADRGTANITPLTGIVVAVAAGTSDLDTLFATPTSSSFASVAANLSQVTASLRASLRPLLQQYSADMDPITGQFVADGTGMDSLLDHINVSYLSGTVSITDKTSGATLFTAPLTRLDQGVSAMAWTSQQGSIARDPDVRVDALGNGLAVWWQYNSDHSASTVQGMWLDGSSAPTQISTSTGFAGSARLAFDAGGNAIVVWAQSDNNLNNVWVNRYVVGAGWGTPYQITNVSSTASAVTGSPSVGVDGTGNAVIAWFQINTAINNNHFDVYTSRYSVATGAWSAPAMLTNGSNSAYNCKVVVNAAGVAAIIWVQAQDDGASGNSGAADVWVSTGATTGVWGTQTKMNSQPYTMYGQADIAIDSAGNILTAWVQNNSNGQFDIWAARFQTGGSWGDPTTLSSGSTGACYGPDLAFDGAGNAIVVWQQQSDADSGQYVAASQYTSGVGWSAPIQIDDNPGNTFDQRVTMDSTGNATVIWYQLEPSGVTVRMARYLKTSGWGASQLVATMDQSYDGSTTSPAPRVGANANGQTFAIWGTDSISSSSVSGKRK